MPTHTELATSLLVDAAAFFRTLAEQNEPLREQMTENANVFEQMAELLLKSPTGDLDGAKLADLAGKLLKDSATFFTTLAEQNEPIRKMMMENASVYIKIADLLMKNPLGEVNAS